MATTRATQKICKDNNTQWSYSGAPMLKFYKKVTQGMWFKIQSGGSTIMTVVAVYFT